MHYAFRLVHNSALSVLFPAPERAQCGAGGAVAIVDINHHHARCAAHQGRKEGGLAAARRAMEDATPYKHNAFKIPLARKAIVQAIKDAAARAGQGALA